MQTYFFHPATPRHLHWHPLALLTCHFLTNYFCRDDDNSQLTRCIVTSKSVIQFFFCIQCTHTESCRNGQNKLKDGLLLLDMWQTSKPVNLKQIMFHYSFNSRASYLWVSLPAATLPPQRWLIKVLFQQRWTAHGRITNGNNKCLVFSFRFFLK